MRICGIVAEYNPFHNGHKYQIEKIRESGFDGIVAVMSGNAVQRGEFAVCDKHIRAKQALLNGVDLVVELPLPFVLSSAEKFAYGAVSVLDSLGVVDGLCFGSECGEINKLEKIAEIDISGKIANYMSGGKTYACAFPSVVESELGEEYSQLLLSPNNVLGIEYIKSIKKLNSKIKPFTVERQGAGHHDLKAQNGFCSAQYIRDNINEKSISEYMPRSSFELLNEAVNNKQAPVRLENNEAVVLSNLRLRSEDYFSHLSDLSEGIENRLYSAVRKSSSLDELYSSVKTKRYTMARVKRLVLNAFLGVTNDFNEEFPPYIRVLGLNEIGREILKNAKLTASKPIYTLFSDFNSADEISKKFYSLECKATDLFYCFTENLMPCGKEQTENAVIIK